MPSEEPSSQDAPVEHKDMSNARLIEYQMAQSSAQHHDGLLWSVTGIFWSANLILLGFVLGNLDEPKLRLLISLLSVVGIVLSVFVCVCASGFRSLKMQKYERCKAIEAEFNGRQHRDTCCLSKVQWLLYRILTSLFVSLWVVVLVTVWLIVPCAV